MKTKRKILSLLLAAIMVISLCIVPVSADSTQTPKLDLKVIWYGADPSTIKVTTYQKDLFTGFYEETGIPYIFAPEKDYDNLRVKYEQLGYDGVNIKWQMTVQIEFPILPCDVWYFFHVNKEYTDGKWSVEPWNLCNLIWQPGDFGVFRNGQTDEVVLTMTSLAPHNGSITVNRNWTPDSAPSSTSFTLYRETTVDGTTQWIEYKTETLPAAQSSYTFSNLYGGKYKIVQNLPPYYSDSYGPGGFFTTIDGNSSSTGDFSDTEQRAHSITVSPAIGGNISVNDKTTAKEGETVSLTITPNAGYILKPGSLKYNDGTDHAISGTAFTMPGRNVILSAEFIRQYAIRVAPLNGGSISTSKTSSVAGERINLTVTPSSGKILKPGTLKYNDDSEDHAISGNSFTMPEHDVTLSAEFKDRFIVSGAGAALPPGEVDTLCRIPLTATNGTQPFSWTAAGLPPGLTIDSALGEITGTPTSAGSFSPSVSVTDANGEIAAASFTLEITEKLAPITDKTLEGLETGYGAGAQIGKDITLTNTGLNDLTGLKTVVTGTAFTITQPAASLAKGASSTFEIKAVDGLASGTYTETVTVTADGLKPVTFTVTQKVSNPRLASLAFGAGTLAPAFNPDTLAYTAAVDTGIAGIAITPVTAEPGATIQVNGTAVTSGQTSQNISLDPGNNTITVLVTTPAGLTRTYTLTVNRGELPLVLDTTSLPTAVIGTAYDFSLSATGGTEPYTWTVTGLPSGLTHTDGVISGTPTDTGKATVTVIVEDSKNVSVTKVLPLTVAQTLTIDLKSLSVGSGTLEQTFDKNTVAYQYQGTTTGSVTVTAEPEDANATLTINGQPAVSGVSATVALEQGANLIPIVVTSPDKLSQKAYVISVNGTVSNTNLAGFAVAGQTLNFDASTTAYTLNVPNGTDSLNLTASPSDPKALMLLNGAIVSGQAQDIALTPGTNTVTVMVVAQDASTKTYTLTISRENTLAIGTASLPQGIAGAPYNATLSATGGSNSYTWTATGLPAWASLDPATGIITGTAEEGQSTVTVTATDANTPANTVTKDLTLKVSLGCGNGGYKITPDTDAAYTSGLTDDGLPTMTINTGVTGFKYFSVNVEAVKGHSGKEVAVFVQMRNGQQIGINATRADFDTTDSAQAGFNVKPGDIIKVYIVDDLNNSDTEVPVIL